MWISSKTQRVWSGEL
uniref:Uncharacterized protein n=1 Tax=Anguilla anguilla TaxID=7936 RepID=A0A0E9W218_ANGAN